jgi:hypothetical protein
MQTKSTQAELMQAKSIQARINASWRLDVCTLGGWAECKVVAARNLSFMLLIKKVSIQPFAQGNRFVGKWLITPFCCGIPPFRIVATLAKTVYHKN